MTVRKSEQKTDAKVEKKVAKEIVKDVEERALVPARQRSKVRVRNNGGTASNFSAQAKLRKHFATANFISGLFHPFDSPSRFPDRLALMKTVLLPFKETGTLSPALISGSNYGWHIELSPTMQRVLTVTTGGTTFGVAGLAGMGRMFTAPSHLEDFVISARCTGLKVRLQYAYIATSSQGYLVGGLIPPGMGGGQLPLSSISQLPHSAAASVCDIVTQGCFEMVWLPSRGAANYAATVLGQAQQQYDPEQYIPFNSDTQADSDAMPTIQVDCQNVHSSAVFLITIEGTFECNCICGTMIGTDERPSDDSWDVLDDVADELFEENTGIVASTPESIKEALAPQQKIVQQIVSAPSAAMSEPTASFMDTAGPILSKVGSEAWGLAKEYGPDIASTLVSLLPGGGLAAGAAKLGGLLGKAFL